MPDPESPESHFSADLALRSLPDLFALINRTNHEDCLAVLLKKLAGEVPLSSVGMELEISPEAVVLRHEGLRQFLVERALRKKCRTSFQSPVLRVIASRKLGRYSDDLGHGLLVETQILNES